MTGDAATLAALAGMAAATALTRLSGPWLVARVRPGSRPARLLEAMPGIVLAALVAPTALGTGPVETVSAAVALILAWRAPLIVAVLGAVAVAAALRALGLGE